MGETNSLALDMLDLRCMVYAKYSNGDINQAVDKWDWSMSLEVTIFLFNNNNSNF